MTPDAPQLTHSLRLQQRLDVADETVELRFDKPAALTFKAGQFMEVTLLDPPETDDKGNARALSIASAPDDPYLAFATRLRDTAFKRTLRTLPIGTELQVDGPFGNFTLHNNVDRPAVLLAGGIGITPFRSFVRRIAHERLLYRLLLFYANRRPEDAPFLDELIELESQIPSLTFVPTVTQPTTSGAAWNGATGHIDYELITRHLQRDQVSTSSMPLYYIAGPPAMVRGLHAELNRGGVDDDDIRTEDFGGY